MPLAEDQNMIQALAPKLPNSHSAYGFCQGDLGDVGRSRIPIARSRRVKACPYAPSLSRTK